MTPTDPDIAAIARGLTKAQQRGVLGAKRAPRFANSQIGVTGPTCMSLVRLGLMYNTVDTIGHNIWGLTPLGLRVRQYLQETARG